MKLCKSYRSTYEITEFARNIQANDELEPVARHAEPPLILKFGCAEDEISGIADLINAFKASDRKSLGIVCKTESQAKGISERLKACTDGVCFLSSRGHTFVQGIVVTSAHMAKGLEFDEVIVPRVDNETYCSRMDRGMLYVAVTRVVHELTLTYNGEVSGLSPRFPGKNEHDKMACFSLFKSKIRTSENLFLSFRQRKKDVCRDLSG